MDAEQASTLRHCICMQYNSSFRRSQFLIYFYVSYHLNKLYFIDDSFY